MKAIKREKEREIMGESNNEQPFEQTSFCYLPDSNPNLYVNVLANLLCIALIYKLNSLTL